MQCLLLADDFATKIPYLYFFVHVYKITFKVSNQIVHKSITILYKTLYNTKNSMLKKIIDSYKL